MKNNLILGSLIWILISTVFVDGKVIVVGGMSVDTNPKDYLMQYDVENDRWKALPSMPTARYATFSFLIGDKLYVIGEIEERFVASLGSEGAFECLMPDLRFCN